MKHGVFCKRPQNIRFSANIEAAGRGHADILLKVLIEDGGADILEQSPEGCTPLMYVAGKGQVSTVEVLLKASKKPSRSIR